MRQISLPPRKYIPHLWAGWRASWQALGAEWPSLYRCWSCRLMIRSLRAFLRCRLMWSCLRSWDCPCQGNVRGAGLERLGERQPARKASITSKLPTRPSSYLDTTWSTKTNEIHRLTKRNPRSCYLFEAAFLWSSLIYAVVIATILGFSECSTVDLDGLGSEWEMMRRTWELMKTRLTRLSLDLCREASKWLLRSCAGDKSLVCNRVRPSASTDCTE